MTTDAALIVSGPPIAEMDGWVDRAACRIACAEGRAESNWWFPEKGTPVTARWAILICKECPVQEQCFEWAAKYEKDGIWAGRSARSRHRWRRAQTEYSAECIDCGGWFTAFRTSGQRPLRCEPCRVESNRRRKRVFNDAVRVANPGSKPAGSLDGGHGKIARYNDGCRCSACKKASRDYRAKYREAS